MYSEGNNIGKEEEEENTMNQVYNFVRKTRGAGKVLREAERVINLISRSFNCHGTSARTLRGHLEMGNNVVVGIVEGRRHLRSQSGLEHYAAE